jgi:hypothetical protein
MGPSETPRSDGAGSRRATTRLEAEVAILSEMVERGIRVDGEVRAIGSERWLIYGRSSYDGELILAQYADAAEARAVLRAVPRTRPAPHEER